MDLIKIKSRELAIAVFRIKKILQDRREFVLANQILKSGTSVGANLAEAVSGQSRRDFVAKMFIAYKELHETAYWLDLFESIAVIEGEQLLEAKALTQQLLRLLTASLKTARRGLTMNDGG